MYQINRICHRLLFEKRFYAVMKDFFWITMDITVVTTVIIGVGLQLYRPNRNGDLLGMNRERKQRCSALFTTTALFVQMLVPVHRVRK